MSMSTLASFKSKQEAEIVQVFLRKYFSLCKEENMYLIDTESTSNVPHFVNRYSLRITSENFRKFPNTVAEIHKAIMYFIYGWNARNATNENITIR